VGGTEIIGPWGPVVAIVALVLAAAAWREEQTVLAILLALVGLLFFAPPFIEYVRAAF
jgi:hypothetical protein